MTNDLVTDQRVARTCHALVEAGYRVTLIGRRLRHSPALKQMTCETIRMRLLFKRSALFYAEYNLRLWLLLLRLRPDAVWANDTDTLAACTLASRMMAKPLIFDAHELFPEVPELVNRPRIRAVWQWIERVCLPHVRVAYTVCQSVADEYKRRYGISMTVVRNLPETHPCNPSSTNAQYTELPHSHLLYQGAVNVGRGVREAMDALEWLPDCHLTIAGDGDIKEQLQSYSQTLPWKERIDFVGRVEPDKLHAMTRNAHLGLCLMEDLGLNYRYSLPNRVGDFIQAGVPLLATDFPEIARVTNEYGTGTLVGPCPRVKEGEDYHQYVLHLARQIADTLDFWRNLPPAERQARFARARAELCWEKEKINFLKPLDAII